MKSTMSHAEEKPKRGRPKKTILQFGSLQTKEYCSLPNGDDLYIKVRKGSKKNNCIVMQTGKVVSIPLKQIVHRVEKNTVRPTFLQEQLVTLEPDVIIDLDE